MIKVLQNLCVLQVLLPKLRLIPQRPQAFSSLRLIHMGTQEHSHNFYKLTPVKLGCEVRGIDLKQDVPPEVMAAIKEDVTKHRLLIFKDQGVVSGERHVEIAKWFNEPESTFYKHPRSPHPDVFRVSNDRSEGCTNVGRTGWHIDGSFQEAPFAYALYHMVLCFHLGMTDSFIWDYKTPQERITKEEETYSLLQEIHHEFIKNNKVRQFSHQWEVGDFIISDNLSVGHEAAPETQLPRSQVGLRILHRVTTKGHYPPAKEYDYRKELGL
ncbi:uncharacterized protein LOC134788594 isoform X2 [Penaeus indicus]|uniref:uncharacterized protein LOC134788594 isoform X2 n=1 Tax=Penaeus indicus TaxID=29960 RepID=UPI00300CC128